MSFPTYEDICRLRGEQNRKACRRRMTDLLCSGCTLKDAAIQIKAEDAILGIYVDQEAMVRS